VAYVMLWVCAGERPAHSCCSWKEKMKAEKEYKTCTHLNSNLGDLSEPTSLQRCIGHIVTPDSRFKASEMLILTEGIAVHGLICGVHLGVVHVGTESYGACSKAVWEHLHAGG
jgi:hypothetical protein